ncbi:MAG: 2-alkenal reductase, partial [Gammaproteobacteria bacterium]
MAISDRIASSSKSKTLVSVLAGLALGALLVWQLVARGAAPLTDPSAAPRPITPRGDLHEGEKAIIALFRQASPSVVHITTLATAGDIFSLNLLQIPEGVGSG